MTKFPYACLNISTTTQFLNLASSKNYVHQVKVTEKTNKNSLEAEWYDFASVIDLKEEPQLNSPGDYGLDPQMFADMAKKTSLKYEY